jgi:uncharacterized membrane protein
MTNNNGRHNNDHQHRHHLLPRRAEPADSIKKSFDLVSKNAGSVLLFAIVITIVNMVTCGLAIGVTEIAVGYAYRQLNGDPVS